MIREITIQAMAKTLELFNNQELEDAWSYIMRVSHQRKRKKSPKANMIVHESSHGMVIAANQLLE